MAGDTRPFRFGLSLHRVGSGAELADMARSAEEVGYDSVLVADHLGFPAPLVTAAAIAAATDRLRVGTFVLNNDFRRLALLAQEAATVDLVSGGRLELGLGAGHMRTEYDEAGLAFDPASQRIARMAEAVGVLRRLFAGEEVTLDGEFHRITGHSLQPLPPQGAGLPILIGGNGDRLLTAAARLADIVGFTGFLPSAGGSGVELSHFGPAGLDDRVAFVRDAAGARFDSLELNALLQEARVTPDRERTAADIVAGWQSDTPISPEVLLESPFYLLGTVAEMADQLRERRERFGISYWVVFADRADGFDAVVEELGGR